MKIKNINDKITKWQNYKITKNIMKGEIKVKNINDKITKLQKYNEGWK